jgi:hypothetical protein
LQGARDAKDRAWPDLGANDRQFGGDGFEKRGAVLQDSLDYGCPLITIKPLLRAR